MPVTRACFRTIPIRLEQAHTCDTRHFGVVVDAHEFVHQSQGKIRILHAVDGKAPPCLVVSVLQIRNNRVVNVLFLLVEEQPTHGVERVGPEFLVALQDLQDVELDPACKHNVA